MPHLGHRIITLPSFSKLYADARIEVGEKKRISTQGAGKAGLGHLIHAIRSKQPAVYAVMCRLRDDAWRLSDGTIRFTSNCFVFMVHSLLQHWNSPYHTKAFLHPHFPNDLNDEAIADCVRQMNIWRVVFRDEVLNGELFYSLREAQILIEQWRVHYNNVRPHSALDYRPPAPESIVLMDQRPTIH